MTSLQSKISKISDALTGIEGLTVYHYWRSSLPVPCCVYYEHGDVGMQADNHKSEYAVEVYVDYYTKVEYDPVADAIMEVLSTTENIGVSYEGAEFEEDTNLIHHSWACEVL